MDKRFHHPGSVVLHLLTVLLLAAGVLGSAHGAAAQTGGKVTITPPDASAFPEIGFYLDAYDAQGDFITALKPEEVQVLENGAAKPPSALEIIQPGLQFTLAYNTSGFLTTPIGDQSLFQLLQAKLTAWASAQPEDTPDDFSLATNSGSLVVHSAKTADWLKAIQEFQPDLFAEQSELTSLTNALDLATDPNPRANMKRAILYITPLPSPAMLQALPNLAERAALQGVRVFVWLVAPANTTAEELVGPLRHLTEHTGGKMFLFSGAEALPDPEQYLQPLRSLYHLTYLSGIRESGAHSLSVLIFRPDFQGQSSEQIFTLSIEPPNPMFLAPPSQIQRSLQKVEGVRKKVLLPDLSNIDILIEFPDGYPRAIQLSRLYVDGVLVDENTSAPFERFDWPLEAYTDSGTHLLKVETVDALGLSRASIETPVEVLVEKAPPGIFSLQIPWQRLAIGGSVLAAALAAVLVLIIRRRKRAENAAKEHRRSTTRPRKRATDPVTQPVPIQQDGPRLVSGRTVPIWPRVIQRSGAPGRLLLLSDTGRPLPNCIVLLNQPEITLGSDARLSMEVLNNPSVEGLHARITQSEEGAFTIADAGSVAGTWVNYAPVSSQGIKLEHGDLINLGRVSFRFELSNPPPPRQPVVTRLEGKK